MSRLTKVVEEATKLLKDLPEAKNIPREGDILAPGMAAYIYIREFELGCRKLMEKNKNDDSSQV